MDAYVWEEPGRLLTRTADFRVVAAVPIEGQQPIGTSHRPIRGSASRKRSPTGIRRFQSTFVASAVSTRTIGSDTARRRRPSCRLKWGSSCGVRGTAIARRCVLSQPLTRCWARFATHSSHDCVRRSILSQPDCPFATCGRTDCPRRAVRPTSASKLTYFSFFLVISALLLAGVVLQARRRAAGPRGGFAPGRRLHDSPRPSPFRRRGSGVVGHWSSSWNRRRASVMRR